jgi:BirA family biotin operon repressor/biotin-[acetyl-CoA-carboxylase] ligase
MSRLQQLVIAAEQRGEVLPAGTVVSADRLTASSGRFDRHWHAPEGGLWLAMAWPDILLPEFTRLLPFAAGLACCRAVCSLGVTAELKWVNDLMAGEKKIGGILCETVLSPSGERWHLLGMGINVNNRYFPAELQPAAACLQEELGAAADVQSLAGRLLAELSWTLGLLHYDEELSLEQRQGCEDGRDSLLLQSWRGHCTSVGRRVEYGFDVQRKPLYQGTVTGIDPCGGLQLTLDDGTSLTEYSGEIRYL